MRRPLPPALERAQRTALSEFYAGRLSAGEFSDRLTNGENPRGEPTADEPPPAPPDHPQRRRLNGLVVLLAVGVAGGGVGIAAGSQLTGSPVTRVAAHRFTPRRASRPTHHHASHPAAVTAPATDHSIAATGSVVAGIRTHKHRLAHRAPRKLESVRSRRSTHRPLRLHRPATSTLKTTTATTTPTTTAIQASTTATTTATTPTIQTSPTTTSPSPAG